MCHDATRDDGTVLLDTGRACRLHCTTMKHMMIEKLALETGLHVETLRRLACVGELPGAYRLGRKWLVNVELYEKGTAHEGKNVR